MRKKKRDRRRYGGMPLAAARLGYDHCIKHRLCVECGGPLKTKRQRSWCGPDCVNAYRLRSDAAYARQAIYARDHGVCASCGVACMEIERRVNSAHTHAVSWWWERYGRAQLLAAWAKRGVKGSPHPDIGPPHIPMNPRPDPDPRSWSAQVWPYLRAARRHVLAKFGMAQWWRRRSFFDVDHVVAVKDGGGHCGLENLQTLCLRCHSIKTAEQNRRVGEAHGGHVGAA